MHECGCTYDYPTDICMFHQKLIDEATKVYRDRIEQLEAALTPSGTTKAAYIGEFKFKISPRREVMVPWTTIKEIMAAIMANAAREKKDD